LLGSGARHKPPLAVLSLRMKMARAPRSECRPKRTREATAAPRWFSYYQGMPTSPNRESVEAKLDQILNMLDANLDHGVDRDGPSPDTARPVAVWSTRQDVAAGPSLCVRSTWTRRGRTCGCNNRRTFGPIVRPWRFAQSRNPLCLLLFRLNASRGGKPFRAGRCHLFSRFGELVDRGAFWSGQQNGFCDPHNSSSSIPEGK
jgi:hypothetical protein